MRARTVTSANGKPRYACSDCGLSYDNEREAVTCCDPRWSIPLAEVPAPNATQVGGSHYTAMTVQPWDVIDTWPLSERVAYYRGNALKYLMRAGSKGAAAEDYAKARHYLDKIVEVLR